MSDVFNDAREKVERMDHVSLYMALRDVINIAQRMQHEARQQLLDETDDGENFSKGCVNQNRSTEILAAITYRAGQ